MHCKMNMLHIIIKMIIHAATFMSQCCSVHTHWELMVRHQRHSRGSFPSCRHLMTMILEWLFQLHSLSFRTGPDLVWGDRGYYRVMPKVGTSRQTTWKMFQMISKVGGLYFVIIFWVLRRYAILILSLLYFFCSCF